MAVQTDVERDGTPELVECGAGSILKTPSPKFPAQVRSPLFSPEVYA
jgi:hypothetical protein